MAFYRQRGQLRLTDSRAEAVDRAARRYDELAREYGHEHVALMTDSSNAEVDALNLRVQALRGERGELGREAVELPSRLAGATSRSVACSTGPRWSKTWVAFPGRGADERERCAIEQDDGRHAP